MTKAGGDSPSPSKTTAADDTLASQAKQTRRERVRESASKLGLKLVPEKPSTKELLMDVGEVVIGRQGVEGVTLREIGQLAGQSNSNVVQYHFANKEGLIAAILVDRVRRREEMRSRKFEDAKKRGQEKDPRELLEILWGPTLSFQDEQGNHSFCRFMLQCRLHSEFSERFPHEERYEGSVIVEVMKLLRDIYPGMSHDVFSYRLSTLTLMFVSSVVEFDNFRQARKHTNEFDLKPLVDMALAALSAPFSE